MYTCTDTRISTTKPVYSTFIEGTRQTEIYIETDRQKYRDKTDRQTNRQTERRKE